MQQSQQQQKKYKRPLSLVLACLFLLGAAQVIADDRLTSTIFLSVNIQPQVVSFRQIAQQNTMPESCGELLAAQSIPTREHAKMRQCDILGFAMAKISI
jgi:hypothetical protein